MKEQIIGILGKNHKTPIEFNLVRNYDEVYGLYTYKGGVYVFKESMDIDFDELESKEQKEVLGLVLSKKWKLNNALQ